MIHTMMMLSAGALLFSSAAHAQEFSKTVKLSKGKAKVEFRAEPAEGAPSTPRKRPRVGIAPSLVSSFGNFLAKRIEETNKAVAVPASQLSTANPFLMGVEQHMRSELTRIVSATCRQGQLDFLLTFGAPEMSTKTDITAMVFFVGKHRNRVRVQSRVYDCRSTQAVWVQNVLFETSRGVVSTAFGGASAGVTLLGSPEAEAAMAGVFAERLAADLRW